MKKFFLTLAAILAIVSCSSDDYDECTRSNDEEVQSLMSCTCMNGINQSHEYVDLGLSVKWATCNVGANSPEECGDYYAWAETETYYPEGHAHDSQDCRFTRNIMGYVWDSYKYQASYPTSWANCTKYTTADGEKEGIWYSGDEYVGTTVNGVNYKNLTRLEAEDDAATVNWGGNWRMPTSEEQQELKDKCYWEWTTDYKGTGVVGYIVYKVKNDSDKGKVHGTVYPYNPKVSYSTDDAHIFLPAAGFRSFTFYAQVESGCYWSSDLSTDISSEACGMYFDSEGFFDNAFQVSQNGDFYQRRNGFCVRPVCR